MLAVRRILTIDVPLLGGISGSHMGGHIVLTGRAKDTIVLSNGENVEPQPVEDALQCSPFIKYAMLIGQDRRQLGALIVADVDAFADLSSSQGTCLFAFGKCHTA